MPDFKFKGGKNSGGDGEDKPQRYPRKRSPDYVDDRTEQRARERAGPGMEEGKAKEEARARMAKARAARKPPDPHKLTEKQRIFVIEFARLGSKVEAARAAGYASPEAVASALTDPDKFPAVCAAIQEVTRQRDARALKSADDILRYIHTAMFFQPLKFFQPGERGGWLIDQAGFDALPPDIGCLIEEVEKREVRIPVVLKTKSKKKKKADPPKGKKKGGKGSLPPEAPLPGDDGDEDDDEGDSQVVYRVSTMYWVRLVSKAQAMTLAAKHQLGEKLSVVGAVIDWDALAKSHKERRDQIAERLREEEGKALLGYTPLPDTGDVVDTTASVVGEGEEVEE